MLLVKNILDHHMSEQRRRGVVTQERWMVINVEPTGEGRPAWKTERIMGLLVRATG